MKVAGPQLRQGLLPRQLPLRDGQGVHVHERLDGPLPRALDHIALSPLVPEVGGRPEGYLARISSRHTDPAEELATLRWTLRALGVLEPGAFLAAWLRGVTPVRAAALANRVSAWVIERVGARPAPDRALEPVLAAFDDAVRQAGWDEAGD